MNIAREVAGAPRLHATDTSLERIPTGATWMEGPVWVPRKRAVRFSDIPGNRILEFSEDTGQVTIYADTVDFTNGRTLDLDGSVIECSHGRRAVQRDRSVGLGERAAPEVLVDHFGDARLNSPNDVVVKSDGTIWFSDPSYGIKRPTEGHAGQEEYGDRYVFRFDPRDRSLLPVVIDVEAPNGLAFSPDEQILYVADSSIDPPSEPDPDRPGGHAIHAYDVYGGRHAKNGRIFAEVSPGLPDGIRVDTMGNVWSSSLDSVQVFDASGARILQIPVPEKVANLCFGGKDGRTLYIAATTSLYRIATTTQDAVTLARSRASQPL